MSFHLERKVCSSIFPLEAHETSDIGHETFRPTKNFTQSDLALRLKWLRA